MGCLKAYAGVHSSTLSLNLSSNLWCKSRSRRSYSLLRPSLWTGIATKNEEHNSLFFRPHCSLCDDSLTANGNSLPRGISEEVKEKNPHNKFLQVVLVSPQIPGNVGSIARTCAASAVGLHLVEPLGFQIDDTKLKRAGLDYWPYVVVKVHRSWADFRDYFLSQDGEKRLLAFTKRGTKIHSEFPYRIGDWLLFGSETSGLPPEAIRDCQNTMDGYGGGTLKIPMVQTYVRCLNLSVSVGIAVYEASRQLNYEQLLSSSAETSSSLDGEQIKVYLVSSHRYGETWTPNCKSDDECPPDCEICIG